MNDWDEERAEIQTWLHRRCATRAEFEFYDQLFDDLTDMADEMMSDDPVLWYEYTIAEDTAEQHAAFVRHQDFLREAYDRGYDLE